jgi:hypothetical protein
MADLEKGIETEAAIGASDAQQIPVMARGEEKGLRISDLSVVPAVCTLSLSLSPSLFLPGQFSLFCLDLIVLDGSM